MIYRGPGFLTPVCCGFTDGREAESYDLEKAWPSINHSILSGLDTEAEFKEKHGELTITSQYVDSRVDSNTCTMGNPMPESTLTLCQSRLNSAVRDLGFGSGSSSSVLITVRICFDCPQDVRSDVLYIYVLYVQAKGSHIEEVSDEILGKLACVYFTINRALKLK